MSRLTTGQESGLTNALVDLALSFLAFKGCHLYSPIKTSYTAFLYLAQSVCLHVQVCVAGTIPLPVLLTLVHCCHAYA